METRDHHGNPISARIDAAYEAESETESCAPQCGNEKHNSSRQIEGIADSSTHAEDAAVEEYDTTFDETQSQRSQGLKDIRCP